MTDADRCCWEDRRGSTAAGTRLVAAVLYADLSDVIRRKGQQIRTEQAAAGTVDDRRSSYDSDRAAERAGELHPRTQPHRLAAMREDSRNLVEQLYGNNKRVWKQSALIEDVESRLSPDRRVTLVLYTVGHGGPGGSDAGVLLLSDYGLHWKGESRGSARLDLPWSSLARAEVIEARSGYDLVAESSNPAYELRFRLYEDPNIVAAAQRALAASQPLL